MTWILTSYIIVRNFTPSEFLTEKYGVLNCIHQNIITPKKVLKNKKTMINCHGTIFYN